MLLTTADEKYQEPIWGTFYSPRNGSTEADTTVTPVNWNLRCRFCCSKAAAEARAYRHLKQLQCMPAAVLLNSYIPKGQGRHDIIICQAT